MSYMVLNKPPKFRPLLPATKSKVQTNGTNLKILSSFSHSFSEHNALPSSATFVTINPSSGGMAMTVRSSDSTTPTEYNISYKQAETVNVETARNDTSFEEGFPEIEMLQLPANTSTNSGDTSISFCSDDPSENQQRLLYDIDLQAPGFDLGSQDECPEEEQLTPSLPPGCLREWHMMPELSPESRDSGIDTFCYPYEAGASFTSIKCRSDTCIFPTSCTNRIDVLSKPSRQGAASVDDLDEPENFNCVNYSDVHMERQSGELLVETLKLERKVIVDKPEQQITEPRVEKVKNETDQIKPLKRPKNGFIRFAMKYRRKVAEDHPRMDNREISRILGIRWRKLSYDEKKTYELEFQTEMNERKLEHPEWRYGGARQYVDPSACEPIPSRLRPRHTLKRRKIPKLTRPYNRRCKNPVVHLTWVQCDRCDKWRQLPYGINMNDMPEKWFCEYNWPPKNYCDAEEDQDDPEDKELNENYDLGIKQEGTEYQYGLEDYVTF